MSIARTLLLRAADSKWLAHQMSRRAFARRAIKRFMPGETLEAALSAAKGLAAQGRGSLLTQLGEALPSLDAAKTVRDHYLEVLGEIKRRGLPSAISVKPTQLGVDQSVDTCRGHLLALAEAARNAGSALWLDMEDHTYVDRTIDLYKAVKAQHDRVGIAIQAYLYRTPKDLDDLFTVNPWIRLVKGAYKEPPAVAYPTKRDVDLAYYDCATRLLDAAARERARPIFGTHDVPLLRRIVAKSRELRVTPAQYEIHMLYGIKTGDQAAFVREGETVKTLVSYGTAWFKWYMRRLAERPANVWFVAKSMVG